MLLTKDNPATQSIAAVDKTRDPLGLTPLPEENRQRYLRFMLSQKNEALIPLSEIVEVMHLGTEDILPVPNMANCVLGICSWQGETLWLVDLNHMVGDRPLHQQSSFRLCSSAVPSVVIVVQTKWKSLGLVVEQVSDVDLFDESSIHQVSGLCPPDLEPYVLGYCPEQKGIVLSVDKMLNAPLWQACK